MLHTADPEPAESAFPTSAYATGSWGGVRDEWKKKGFEFIPTYTSEPAANIDGGEKNGSTYIQNIDFDFKLDLERLFAIPRTKFMMKVSQRSGDSLSAEKIVPSEGGNQFTVQEAFGPTQNVRLVNAQFGTTFLDERLDLAYGRIVANDDFLRSPLYCYFINNSFCGSPQAVFLQNPFAFSAYPTAAWGARARYDTASRDWTLQVAVYDADPNLTDGDPANTGNNDHGTDLSFGDNGATWAGEVQYHVNRGSTTALPGVYKVGGFYMDGDYQDIGKTDNSTVQGNAMVWLLADQALYREAPGSNQGLAAFGAVTFSLEDRANTLDYYFALGLLYRGWFEARPKDVTGLGITAGWFSDEISEARKFEGKEDKDYEGVIELNHKFEFLRGISFAPNIQYIIKPAGLNDIDNALVVGFRLNMQI
jgi:porin